MTDFKYKTRGMKSPQGLPGVYFCSHSEDFDSFFDILTQDILDKEDCAVWYAQIPDADRDEEFLSDLGQMQLFVMPVTSKLLFTDNVALNVEFRFALENHIPVLPVMMESCLEAEFNRKCGDLQFLEKYVQDTTAISYEDKLTKFLEAVLIGDETAQKIKDAFVAYIFLSYRKKDRRFAQELMRLIHKNDFCRDIAIWYDEFLTPGENFNDNIAEALNKSQLFALAVTPNLVNEDNYVQSTEYPMAVKARKTIIPAEVMPTDKALLSQKFEGIPEVFDAYDEEKLSQVMMSALETIAVRKREDTPQSNYLIGLAYLSGVDVEVDSNRALKLITTASEAGLAEAAGKLAQMYRNGIGVARDYYTAAAFQDRKVAILESEYERTPSETLLNDLFWEMSYCGDCYLELGKYDDAESRYLKAISYVTDHGYPDEGYILLRDLSAGYNKLGDVLIAKGDFEQTLECQKRAYEISEQLAYDLYTTESRYNLFVCYIKLGEIYEEQGLLQKAIENYGFALEVIEMLTDDTQEVSFRREVAVSCQKIGEIYKLQGNLEDAFEYCCRFHDISKELAEEEKTEQAYRDLVISYCKLGEILEAEGEFSEALKCFSIALDMAEDIYRQTETIQAQIDVAVCCYNSGSAYELLGDTQKAKEYYFKSIRVREILAEKLNTPDSWNILALLYWKYSYVTSEGLEYLGKAYMVYHKLHADYPDVSRYSDNMMAIAREMDKR